MAGSIPAKHFVVLIHPGLLFQGIFLAHREIIHLVYIQDPLQVRMPDKIHPEKIIGFSLHPVGRGKKPGCGKHVRLGNIRENLKPDTDIVYQVMQMIHYRQFPSFLVRVIPFSFG